MLHAWVPATRAQSDVHETLMRTILHAVLRLLAVSQLPVSFRAQFACVSFLPYFCMREAQDV